MNVDRRSGMPRILWLVVAASVPLSVRVYMPAIGTEVIFPAEPLLGVIAVSAVIRWLRLPAPVEMLRTAMRSTVVRLATAWIALHVFAALFSTDPLASWKVVTVQTVYILALLPFPATGAAGAYVNRWDERRSWHDAALLVIMVPVLTVSAIHGLDRMAVNFAPFPFYKDHTLYAAVLCFVLFRTLGKVDNVWRARSWDGRGIALLLLLAGLVAALTLSFGRAAWIGAFIALLLYAAFRPPWRHALVLTAVLISTAVVTMVGPRAARSGAPASHTHGAGPLMALRSITNTATDPNNTDRMLRWRVSWRMFVTAPFTGLGPGTWQDRMEGFLSPAERGSMKGALVVHDEGTRPAFALGGAIWLRDHAGRAAASIGSAHSEYLLALSETGIAGGLWWAVALVLTLLRTGHELIMARRDPSRTAAWACGLALCAYFTQAFFNNFLDDCKAALLFWPCLAVLFNHRA